MKRALCIGINDYPGLDSDLSGCVPDAKAWAAELTKRGFVVKTMFDGGATRENIIANLKHLVEPAVEGDLLVFQYSGHGTQVPDTSGDETDKMDEALCPYDLWTKGPVLDDDIWRILRSKKPGVEIIFISDSCHSGSVVRAFSAPHQGKKKFIPYTRFIERANSNWIDALSTREPDAFDVDEKAPWPVLLLSGCQDIEYSYDATINGKPHGAFTYWALHQLKTLPEDATYLDWYNTIRKKLPSNDYPQCPNILGSYQKRKIFS